MIDDTLPKPDADKLAAQAAELPDDERALLARCIAAEQ